MAHNDVAPNPPPQARKPSKTQLINIYPDSLSGKLINETSEKLIDNNERFK